MDLIDILLAILLVLASVLCLYLIKLVKRLFITINIIESELGEFDRKVTPLIHELTEMANSGNSIASYAKDKTDYVVSWVDGFKRKFDGFINRKDENVSPQSNARNLVANLKALVKGASTFINEIKK